MRRHRLLPIPLALSLALAAAAPASAAEVEITATDFEFNPSPRAIAVGDTVIWRFAMGSHTTTAASGQAERWNSGPRTTPAGETFRHTFNRPGRFQYFCIPHAGFMRGVVTVGSDAVRDTVDAFRTTRSGSSVRVSFRLNEPAVVSLKLRGAERRTVRRGRLGKGRHSFSVRNLDAGSYRGTLALADDFDKKSTAQKSFVIR
jgi:plastocyanin